MKLPNGYGSVVKLPGNRRKPYAVRISYTETLPDGSMKRKRKYLEYFSKQDAALKWLAEYNSGNVVPEHSKYTQSPTFAETYEKWKQWKKGLKQQLSQASWKNYEIAYNHFSDIHQRKMITLKTNDLQECLNAWNHKSKTTVGTMRSLIKGVCSYALMNEIIDSNPADHLVYEFTETGTSIHSRFSDEEIATLWKQCYVINNVDIILIFIYTGMRPTELLEMLTENVHLEERYMVGGLKTENGYNRLIPLCDKVLPLIKNRFDPNRKFLINNKYGNHYTYGSYQNGNWQTVINKLGMKHSPHDGRYTFAALADNADMNEVCQKLIMGHAIPDRDFENFKSQKGMDITKGVYTQKTMAELLKEVNKI